MSAYIFSNGYSPYLFIMTRIFVSHALKMKPDGLWSRRRKFPKIPPKTLGLNKAIDTFSQYLFIVKSLKPSISIKWHVLPQTIDYISIVSDITTFLVADQLSS